MTKGMRIGALVFTLAICALIVRRMPLAALAAAFHDADYATFLALVVPNTIFYFCWDTLVLTTVVAEAGREVAVQETEVRCEALVRAENLLRLRLGGYPIRALFEVRE